MPEDVCTTVRDADTGTSKSASDDRTHRTRRQATMRGMRAEEHLTAIAAGSSVVQVRRDGGTDVGWQREAPLASRFGRTHHEGPIMPVNIVKTH